MARELEEQARREKARARTDFEAQLEAARCAPRLLLDFWVYLRVSKGVPIFYEIFYT